MRGGKDKKGGSDLIMESWDEVVGVKACPGGLERLDSEGEAIPCISSAPEPRPLKSRAQTPRLWLPLVQQLGYPVSLK